MNPAAEPRASHHPFARYTARLVLALAWTVAGALSLAVVVEGGLRMVEESRADDPSPTPRFDAVERAYAPFRVQHLHPLYFYFFPLEAEARVALSNDVCSLTREGFRGPGPEQRGDRRLAFLIGGSAAFGDGTESDAETITAHLNRLQSSYFFVNAGVPSWASAQELIRLSFQLLDYEPALVISMGGINDFAAIGSASMAAQDGVLGMPQHYELLTQVVEGRRWPTYREGPWSVWPIILPSTAARLGIQGGWREGPFALLNDPAATRAAVRRYVANLRRMSDLTRASGARFIAVGQPVAWLHRNLSRPDVFEADADLEAFHDAVVATPKAFEWHDLSSMFDDELAVVPMRVDEIMDDTIFLDDVHMRGRGNAMVAARIVPWLIAPAAEVTPPK